jgi:UDP-N-acetyl-D-glucosamine dehydrogenase
MPEWVVQKLADALNERGKSVKGSRILLVGVAYKRNVDDVRESPALEIIELLLARGADVRYHDPHVPRIPSTRRHTLDLASTPLDDTAAATSDAVLIVTDHDAIDYARLATAAPLIVDTRNAFARRGLSFAGVLA